MEKKETQSGFYKSPLKIVCLLLAEESIRDTPPFKVESLDVSCRTDFSTNSSEFQDGLDFTKSGMLCSVVASSDGSRIVLEAAEDKCKIVLKHFDCLRIKSVSWAVVDLSQKWTTLFRSLLTGNVIFSDRFELTGFDWIYESDSIALSEALLAI